MEKVSVIIPTYNRPKFLVEAIKSVLSQTKPCFEIIIINDASEDYTHEFLNELKLMSTKVHIITTSENSGVSACRNLGIEYSTGDFVFFLDDDDLLMPNMVQSMLNGFIEHEADILSCRTEVVSDSALITNEKLKTYNWQSTNEFSLYALESLSMEHICLYNPVIHSFMVRKEVIETLRFNDELSYGEDFLFWLQLAEKGTKFRKLKVVGVKYRLHGNSSTLDTELGKKLDYYRLLSLTVKLSPKALNILYFKKMILSLKNKMVMEFIKCLFLASVKPHYFMKHAIHYLRTTKS